MTATRATLPVLRALLDQARAQGLPVRRARVSGRARSGPGAPEFTHADVPVRVVPCVSALAVREALLGRVRDQWLVVLTDRPDEDLGAGVLSHLVWHRLRTPDPWDAVRHRFAATGIDPALTAAAGDREIAIGLLAAAPPAGWPPAPGGVLTRDHAFGAVAAAHLGLTDPVIDATSVLAWTADPALVTRVADLRALAGDALTDAVLDWAASRAGAAGQPLRHLLRAGEARDAVPLGLVAGLLAAPGTGRRRFPATGAGGADPPRTPARRHRPGQPRCCGPGPRSPPPSWPGCSRIRRAARNGEALLARADELLAAGRAAGLADGSDLLPVRADPPARVAGGRAARRPAAREPPPIPTARRSPAPHWRTSSGPGPGWPPTGSPTPTRGPRPSTPRCGWPAGWRPTPPPAATSLQALLGRHGDSDAWVDSAVNDAAPGVSDPDLGAGLAAVLAAVRARRAAHDTAFAARWPRTPATTRPVLRRPVAASGTWRTCCPGWSCRWPAAPRCCCSSWTG